MTEARKVLMIGLAPDVVAYDRYPGLTPEKLEAMLRADEKTLNEIGYDAEICFVDHGETAEATVSQKLATADYACIMIGAGVRLDPEEFLLFEKLINTVHQKAPGARICFNTGPTDSVAAVQRWA